MAMSGTLLPSAVARHLAGRWLVGGGSAGALLRGFVVAVIATFGASAVGMLIEDWVQYYNLLLLYVIAALYVGVRCGAWPAALATLLVIPNVSFFLAAPIYDFAVHSREEWTTLLHMTAISAVSGQVAARVRVQFHQLQEAHRSSQALVELGHRLLAASEVHQVWLALVEELRNALGMDCRLATRQPDGQWRFMPPLTGVADQLCCPALDGLAGRIDPVDPAQPQHLDLGSAGAFLVFAIAGEQAAPFCLLVAAGQRRREVRGADRELIAIMVRHAVETRRRIEISRDLDEAKRDNDREQLRSALLSSVSHDLKSPLSAMMGAAESLLFLESQLSPGDRRELVSTILQESQRLESYIQNLLDMTRLEYGALSIERDWVALDDLVGSAMDRVQRYNPGIVLDYQSACGGLLLWVNNALIEQAFFNILENAVKYSPAGEEIHIRARRGEQDCVVEVEDRGPGIPPEFREVIFDMFHVVAEGDKRQSGTGMGLAICRGMVAAHGGTVRAEAGADGIGTRMVVTLPVSGTPEANTIHPTDNE